MLQNNIVQIERFQRRAYRIILNYNVVDQHKSMDDVRMMSFSERVFLWKAKSYIKLLLFFSAYIARNCLTIQTVSCDIKQPKLLGVFIQDV